MTDPAVAEGQVLGGVIIAGAVFLIWVSSWVGKMLTMDRVRAALDAFKDNPEQATAAVRGIVGFVEEKKE